MPKTTFKPGQSGNPNGRPKKQESLTIILAEIGDIKDIKTKTDVIDRKTALAQRLWSIALSGDLAAIKYIYDRVDGTPRQSIALDAKMEGSLTQDFFKIVMVDPQSDENATPSDSTD